jgi:hypothetical protein
VIQVSQDRFGVGGEEFLGVGGENDGNARIGKSVCRHQAASGTETMMCALVPLIPNAVTAARRWPSVAGHGVSSVANRNPCF